MCYLQCLISRKLLLVFGLQARNSVVELVCCLLYYYLFLLILVPDSKNIQHRPCFVDLIAYNTVVVMSCEKDTYYECMFGEWRFMMQQEVTSTCISLSRRGCAVIC